MSPIALKVFFHAKLIHSIVYKITLCMCIEISQIIFFKLFHHMINLVLNMEHVAIFF